jgi:hypothetical protein
MVSRFVWKYKIKEYLKERSRMLGILQRTSRFYISKFEAAAKAIKESGKEPWVEKISKN